MKQVYENFADVAENFKGGWAHQLSDHTPDECFAWQHGVTEFAHFLDGLGLKIIDNPDFHKILWGAFENYKPDSYTPCVRRNKT